MLKRETPWPSSGSSSVKSSAAASAINPAWSPKRQLAFESAPIQAHARKNQKRWTA